MEIKYLLDSVILIDHLSGIPAATEYLGTVSRISAISVITRAEVLAGAEADSEKSLLRLLDLFPVLAIDTPIADLAARLRREHRWKLPDALQAAVAQVNGLKLVTRNTRDFPAAKHKFVLTPYTV